MDNIKEYIERYVAFGKAIPYDGLKIRPVLVKDFYHFRDAQNVLKIDKNKIPDIEIIQMTYLRFLMLMMVEHSELVEDFRMIQFENTDTAFFKANWMYFSDNYILIKQSQASLKLYSKDGKFLRNIGNIGQGPGEYQSLSDIAIDETNGYIYVLPFIADYIYKYNLTGEFIDKIKLGKRINKGKIFLQSENILSLAHLCFKDLNENFTGLNLFLEYPDSIQYIYAKELASNVKDESGLAIGYNHEIWSYRNANDFAFMMTHTDTLFHYNHLKNQIIPQFTMEINPDKVKNSFFILNELPHHYLAIITGKSGRNILVEKESKVAYEIDLVNDYMGNMKISPKFQDKYFFNCLEPSYLKEKIEEHLASGNCPESHKEKLHKFSNTLNENDNNILFLGKLKE